MDTPDISCHRRNTPSPYRPSSRTEKRTCRSWLPWATPMKSPFGSTGGNNLPSSLFLNSKCHRLFIAVFRRLFRFDITLVTTNADLIDKLTQQAMPVMHMPGGDIWSLEKEMTAG